MKVCKKCKKKVANKSKICKYCGADVSKAKIIKSTTNTKKQQKPIVKNTTKKRKPVVVTQEQPKKTITHKHNNKVNAINISEDLKKASKYIVLEIINALKNSIVITFESLIVIFKSMFNITNKSAKYIKSKNEQSREKRIEKKKNKETKIKKQEEIAEVEDEFTKPKKVRSKRYKRIKLAFVLSLIVVFLGAGYCGYKYVYDNVIGESVKVVVGEKATTDKVFSMNDVITYNDVDYKIVKIETSKGNNYKTPKAGHQFLIVTVYIKNNSNHKAAYSYENWTMSNSKGEEKKRIFTSINVDTALYSGELVIGGVKTGSMVFEQPVNDQKLKMNYYELKKDKDGNEVIDEAKRIFSISVKSPNKSKNQDSIVKEENTKIIKNS